MMQASKKVPFDDPTVLNGVRALYVITNLIIVGIYVYVGMQIDKQKGTRYPPKRIPSALANQIV
jgi:NADH:ubiquinone oxidoreductase subunit F (NADH-binding)